MRPASGAPLQPLRGPLASPLCLGRESEVRIGLCSLKFFDGEPGDRSFLSGPSSGQRRLTHVTLLIRGSCPHPDSGERDAWWPLNGSPSARTSGALAHPILGVLPGQPPCLVSVLKLLQQGATSRSLLLDVTPAPCLVLCASGPGGQTGGPVSA